MEFVINSFVGAGSIKFGMDQQSVRNLLSGQMRSFKRTPAQIFPSDHFMDLGVVISYSPLGVVEAVEFSEPSDPVFDGIRFLGQDVELVRSAMEKINPEIEQDGDGFISHQLGISIYALSADEESADPVKILSVLVFERGYYD